MMNPDGDMDNRNIPDGINNNGQIIDEFFEGNHRFMPTHVVNPDPAASATNWSETEEIIAAQQIRRQGALTSAVFTPHPQFEYSQTMDGTARVWSRQISLQSSRFSW